MSWFYEVFRATLKEKVLKDYYCFSFNLEKGEYALQRSRG